MTADKATVRRVRSTDIVEISEKRFAELAAMRGSELISVCMYLAKRDASSSIITRPLAGRLLSSSAQLEEFLDAYGARNNSRWHTFRQIVSFLKTFADASYKLLHIKHSYPSYRLLPVDGDFEKDTHGALLFTCEVIGQAAARLLEAAKELSLPVKPDRYKDSDFEEDLPPGRLPGDRLCRRRKTAAETVAHLSTAFLNLAAESECLHIPARYQSEQYCQCFPDAVNEEDLRQLEHKFHNLQSLYDTYVSDTDVESLDRDLPILRGHISIIFHLLETSVHFAHHYERHVMGAGEDTVRLERPLVDRDLLLDIMVEYCLAYSSRYLKTARSLCQQMLGRYATIGTVKVPVPKYRGFHVRPSTLVAKIAMHYGSKLEMCLGDESYDAAMPIDLFRANEKINREKRRKLSDEIARMKIDIPESLDRDMVEAVRNIVASLTADGKIVIYERPLPLEELAPEPGETISQFAIDEITRLLMVGKIDIESNIEVEFVGDERVLNDIKILAQAGYGEDSFGNNIALPKELTYLRR